MSKATISNRIRYLRFVHREMTQQQLAEKVGCTRQTVIAIEREKYVPSLMLAFKIARAFDETVEAVFTFSEEPD